MPATIFKPIGGMNATPATITAVKLRAPNSASNALPSKAMEEPRA
jgi:hypothetical protein